MRFPQELVSPDEFTLPAGKPAAYKVSARELDMAAKLIESMSDSWKPSEFRDDFRDKLHKFIAQRVAKKGGGKSAEPEAEPHPKASSNVVDFVALLKKSLETKGKGADDKGRASSRRPAGTRRRAG
jgi:DNA end-binding protein Ku